MCLNRVSNLRVIIAFLMCYWMNLPITLMPVHNVMMKFGICQWTNARWLHWSSSGGASFSQILDSPVFSASRRQIFLSIVWRDPLIKDYMSISSSLLTFWDKSCFSSCVSTGVTGSHNYLFDSYQSSAACNDLFIVHSADSTISHMEYICLLHLWPRFFVFMGFVHLLFACVNVMFPHVNEIFHSFQFPIHKSALQLSVT